MVVQGDRIQATNLICDKKKMFPSILAIFCPVFGKLGCFGPKSVENRPEGSKNDHKIRKKNAADPMTAFPGGTWAVLSACQTLGHENDV